MSNKPIGIFDSGVGGTSIWKEIHALLPNESSIYLADSKYAPYGRKSKEEILRLSIKNTELLLQKDCKIIVVACNTATTNAIAYLRANYPVPFIGIEPAIKPAALQSKTKSIGILATKGTLSSELFHNTSEVFAKDIKVIEQVGTGLVELIENGLIHSDEMTLLLERYCLPMVKENIDHLVLGCTHYPYLIPKLKEILPNTVKIIDSGAAVAKQTQQVLQEKGLEKKTKDLSYHHFYSNSTNIKTLAKLIDEKYATSYLDF